MSYIINGKRIIHVAIKEELELPENSSDEEVDHYLAERYPCKEFQWCDGNQDIFGDF